MIEGRVEFKQYSRDQKMVSVVPLAQPAEPAVAAD
jgi:hypothetical protein